MRKTLTTLAALAVGALGGWAATVATTPEPAAPQPVSVVTPAPSYDPYDQVTFPCQEDEVLGFSPRFGPDRVGCVHFEDIAG